MRRHPPPRHRLLRVEPVRLAAVAAPLQILAAGVLGGAVAAASVGLLALAGIVALERGPRPPWRRVTTTLALLTVSAVVEELVFRVVLIGILEAVAPLPAAVVSAAVLFAAPHVVRGADRATRAASVVTSFGFGVLLGGMWVHTRSLLAIVAFHLAFNATSGLVLGGGAIDPVNRRDPRPTPVWPLAQRARRTCAGWRDTAVLAGAELVPLALVAPVLLR